MVGLGHGMVNVLHRQVELVGMVLRLPAVFSAPVGEDALQPDALLIDEGNYSVIQQVRGADGALVGVELGGGHSTVGQCIVVGKVC